MDHPNTRPVELLYRPAAPLRLRPHTRGNYRQTCDVVYAEAHGVGLIMDVFAPVSDSSGVGVVDIVSGGWFSDRTLLNEHIGFGILDALCERGITVFAVSPGSMTLFDGPAMVRHIHAAIRHIKANAARYGVAPQRLGLLGVSAGGHLGALAALAPKPARMNARDPLRHWDTRVAAAAVFFPPSDLLDYGGKRFDHFRFEGFDFTPILFHGGVDDKSDAEIVDRLIALSPAKMPAADAPPFMIVHGKADVVVPWEQAEKLAEAVRRAGGQATLRYNETGGHVWPNIHIEVEEAADWLLNRLL